jgi:hypothetical protein
MVCSIGKANAQNTHRLGSQSLVSHIDLMITTFGCVDCSGHDSGSSSAPPPVTVTCSEAHGGVTYLTYYIRTDKTASSFLSRCLYVYCSHNSTKCCDSLPLHHMNSENSLTRPMELQPPNTQADSGLSPDEVWCKQKKKNGCGGKVSKDGKNVTCEKCRQRSRESSAKNRLKRKQGQEATKQPAPHPPTDPNDEQGEFRGDMSHRQSVCFHCLI